MKNLYSMLIVLLVFSFTGFGQAKKSVAVLSIDTRNLDYDSESITDLVRIELEKILPEVTKFTVLNKKGNWDERNGDMYDGIVCSLYKKL